MTTVTFEFLISPEKLLFLPIAICDFPFRLSSSFFKVFSLTMSSFIFDSTIGICDSDSGGLVQQPLVD